MTKDSSGKLFIVVLGINDWGQVCPERAYDGRHFDGASDKANEND